MRRIPRQSHRPPAAPIPLHSRPLRQPLAPKLLISRQRKQRRAERLSVVLCKVIPGASDIRRSFQTLVANLVTERDSRRPGPTFRLLAVRRDVD